MVYCGKPSYGCSNCRQRKIKCDQVKPHCGQCRKTQLHCNGYRNLVDLMFRNENERVIEKATSYRTQSNARRESSTVSFQYTYRRPLSRASKPTTSTCKEVNGSNPNKTTREAHSIADLAWLRSTGTALTKNMRKPSGPKLLLPYHNLESLHERGRAFFFSRHVFRYDSTYENYDFIYDVWRPHTNDTANQDFIDASVVAIGLAGLAKITRSVDMIATARRSYDTALRLTAAALSDPVKAATDPVMLSVLLLGTYELTSGATPQPTVAWQKHVAGAAVLANLRQAAHFETSAGCKMFQMLCHNALISCVRSGIPAPAIIEELQYKFLIIGKLDQTSSPFINHMFKTTKLLHNIKTGLVTGVSEITYLLGDCDIKWASLACILSNSSKYHVLRFPTVHPVAMHRSCHVYPHMIAAVTWNGIRLARMMLQEGIIEQLCPTVDDAHVLSSTDQEIFVNAIKTHNIMTDAIIASVPHFLGIVRWMDIFNSGADSVPYSAVPNTDPGQSLPGSPEPELTVTPHEEVVGCKEPSFTVTSLPFFFGQKSKSSGQPGYDFERTMTLTASCKSIIWPLYKVGMSKHCSRAKRSYALERLAGIYEETGLDNAMEAANAVRQDMAKCCSINDTF